MKKTLLISAIVLGGFLSQSASAQVHISVNIGVQPAWGPVGYSYVEYYYLPDIEAYYYVPGHEFVYYEGRRWVYARHLPPRYSHYNLYSGYKVVINEPRPYLHFAEHRARYAPHRHYDRQVVIRDRPHYREEYRGHHGNGYARGHEKYHGHEGHHGNPHKH